MESGKNDANVQEASSTTGQAVPKGRRPLWAELVERLDPDIPKDEIALIYELLPYFHEKGDNVVPKDQRPEGHKILPSDDEDGEKLREILRGIGFEEWVAHRNLSSRLLRSRKAQRKYEIFCGGFLYFYDVELGKYPQKVVDEYPKKFPGEQFGEECQKKLVQFFGRLEVNKEHTIFFDWGRDYVRIYINPRPGNPDPPSTPAPPPPETSA